MLLLGDESGHHGYLRYHVWRWFTVPGFRARHPAEEYDRLSRAMVADLRAAAARHGDDREARGLVNRLCAASPDFARLWDTHEVAVRRADHKRFLHHQVGPVDVDCETLVTPDQRQLLLVLSPRAGTDAAEKLALLSVIGSQRLDSPAS